MFEPLPDNFFDDFMAMKAEWDQGVSIKHDKETVLLISRTCYLDSVGSVALTWILLQIKKPKTPPIVV